MAHTHIGAAEWPVIARLLKAGYSIRAIAEAIGKDHSTVSRHVRANGGRDGYDIHEVRRRKRMMRIAAMDGIRILKGALLRTVVKLLKEHLSPEQIAGVLALSGTTIVASTIYRYLDERPAVVERCGRLGDWEGVRCRDATSGCASSRLWIAEADT